jgi:hypothetical protein
MDALITGTKPGKLVDDIPCYIEFADEPIYLHVEADIKVKFFKIYLEKIEQNEFNK